MSVAPFQRRLIDAVQTQQVAAFARRELTNRAAMLSDTERHQCESALQACRHVDELVATEADALMSALSAKGIRATLSPTGQTGQQFALATVQIVPDAAATAVQTAFEIGLWHPRAGDASHWANVTTSAPQVVLTRIADDTTRIVLRWRPTRASLLHRAAGRLLPSPLRRIARRVAKAVRRPVSSEQSRGSQSLGEMLSTPQSLLPQLFDFAGLGASDVLIDIGCGDGRVVIDAAQRRGCRAIGIEHDEHLCTLAKRAAQQHDVAHRVEIRHQDALDAELNTATVVFLFVPVTALATLVPLAIRKLRAGGRVIAHEQQPMQYDPPPDVSQAVISASALTVAHRWNVPP